MAACIAREAPRVEKLEDDLLSVGKVVVNVVRIEQLKAVAGLLSGIPKDPNSLQLEKYNSFRETLAFGYEIDAVKAAITAREARLIKARPR